MFGSLPDTPPEILARQRENRARMTARERADAIDAMYVDATECAVSGIRRANPDVTDREIRSILLVRRFGQQFVDSLPPEVR